MMYSFAWDFCTSLSQCKPYIRKVENGNSKEGISECGNKTGMSKETRIPPERPGWSRLDQMSCAVMFLWAEAWACYHPQVISFITFLFLATKWSVPILPTCFQLLTMQYFLPSCLVLTSSSVQNWVCPTKDLLQSRLNPYILTLLLVHLSLARGCSPSPAPMKCLFCETYLTNLWMHGGQKQPPTKVSVLCSTKRLWFKQAAHRS